MDEVEKDLRTKKIKGQELTELRLSLIFWTLNTILTTLFNAIFDPADYPKDWAQGLSYTVHEKGDKSFL